MSKPLGSDLSYNQFLFCEAYLRIYNVDKACRIAYPNMHTHNGSNILKSRKVQKYLRERLEEKKATIERLTDKMYDVLCQSMYSDDPTINLEATKQVARIKEIEAKINSFDDPTDSTITINFGVAQKDEDDNKRS